MHMIQKVSAYITRNNSLLVFKQPDFPEAGIQVPAGTIEDGETPEEAVMREAYEETGLAGLRLHCYLGSCQQDLSDYGVAEIHQRYFFHLLCDEDCPETWSHAETHPSGGEQEVILFDLYWMALSEAPSVLLAIHAQMLDKLLKQEYRR